MAIGFPTVHDGRGGGKNPFLLTGRNLQQEQPHVGGDSPADGQMGKGGEEGRREESTHHLQHLCNYCVFS